MKTTRVSARLAVMVAGCLLLSPALVAGQENARDQPERHVPKILRPVRSADSIRAINDDFDKQLLQLERGRLDRLDRLAQRQEPGEAAATYEQLFRLAIASNLFQEAEQAAATVVRAGSPSPTTTAWAIW